MWVGEAVSFTDSIHVVLFLLMEQGQQLRLQKGPSSGYFLEYNTHICRHAETEI